MVTAANTGGRQPDASERDAVATCYFGAYGGTIVRLVATLGVGPVGSFGVDTADAPSDVMPARDPRNRSTEAIDERRDLAAGASRWRLGPPIPMRGPK